MPFPESYLHFTPPSPPALLPYPTRKMAAASAPPLDEVVFFAGLLVVFHVEVVLVEALGFAEEESLADLTSEAPTVKVAVLKEQAVGQGNVDVADEAGGVHTHFFVGGSTG